MELKDIYDDAILEGTIRGASVTERYEAKIKATGHDGMAAASFIMRSVERMAEKKGGDGILAYGIAAAIQNSSILYGTVGEEFLKQKAEQEGETFSRQEYIKDLAELMLEKYRGKRKEKIMQGIDDAINDRDDNIEAAAAKAGLLTSEYGCSKEYEKSQLISENFISGKTEKFSEVIEVLSLANYGEITKEEAIKNLNILYRYYDKNFEELREEFPLKFENFPRAKEIAYFIANLGKEEAERFVKKDL